MEGVDPSLKEDAELYIQTDLRPNSRLSLGLYNFFNTSGGKYKTEKIRNVGEPPHLLDSLLVDISTREIQKFLIYKGFFKAKVSPEVDVKNKRAYITFKVNPGTPFTVGSVSRDIPDGNVNYVYVNKRKEFTRITPGKRYDADSVMNEINSLYAELKAAGYYDFMKQYIHVDLDSSKMNNTVDLKLRVYNPPGKSAHTRYIIKNPPVLDIRTADGHRRGITPDSGRVDSLIYVRDYSHRFRFKPLSRYVFLRPGEMYSSRNENLTYDRLYDLNTFRNLQITYTKNKDSVSLDPHIDITPLKRMSNRIEGEYTFNTSRNGFSLANTYTNRNLFGGAEQLEVKLRYGMMFDAQGRRTLFGNVFNRDFQIGVNMRFPLLLIPFRTSQTTEAGVAHTTFSTSMQIFDQPNAFRNRLFINSITYDWKETKYKQHSFTPISIEYRDGRLDPRFRDSIRALGYEGYIRTNDRRYFNMGSIYSFTYNALRLSSLDNFFYFRGMLDLGGNTLNLLSHTLGLHRDSTGARTFLGLPLLQYAKTELDFRFYKHLGGERQLVFRLNPGIAASYGSSARSGLPFEKNFFGGGFSGVRAWQARTLGPGNYNRKDIPSEDLRKNLTYLDQYGDIKLEGNIEYRFKLMNKFLGSKLKGALFTDFGNVWRIDETSDTPGGQFKFDKFFNQLAVGAGAGLRFDLQYFVFRLDVGAKIKDPQFQNGDQWVVKYLFNKDDREAFKSDYQRTNAPDRYRFLQYNFGIGMPF